MLDLNNPQAYSQDFIENASIYEGLFEECWERVSQEPEFSKITKPGFTFVRLDHPISETARGAYFPKLNLIVLNNVRHAPGALSDATKISVKDTIFHELCHCVHDEHSDEFYSLLHKFYSKPESLKLRQQQTAFIEKELECGKLQLTTKSALKKYLREHRTEWNK